MNFWKKLALFGKNLSSQMLLVSYWVLLLIFVLVSIPAITTKLLHPFDDSKYEVLFDGLDISDITNGKVPLEFKFSPTLDFYPGSKQVFAYSGEKTVDHQKIVQDIEQRLNNIGMSNYYLYGRENSQKDLEIVLESGLDDIELQQLQSLLQSNGKIQFAKQTEQATTTDTTNQQPTYTPIDLDSEDIDTIDLIYGSDIGGYGLNIVFKDSIRDQILVSAVSDINSNNSDQLFLTLDGQVVAAQRYAISSSQARASMTFASYFGNNQIAARYFKDMITNPQLNHRLVATNSFPIPGTYERFTPWLKYFFVAALIISLLALVYTKRGYGLYSWLNLIFMVFGTLAIAKLFELPISAAGIIGFISAIAFYVLATSKILLLNPFDRNTRTIDIDSSYIQQIRLTKSNLLSYLVAASAVLILINNLSIPVLNEAGQMFIAGVAITYLSILVSIPATLNLIES